MAAAPRSLPADARRSLLVYNLFFPIVFLCLLPGFLLRMIRRGGFRNKFGQRLGWYAPEDRARWKGRRWIWIHSISVGETFIALKLARAIHERQPEVGILLSATTSTGFAEVTKAVVSSPWLEPIYNPVDLRSIVRRTLDVFAPEQLILIEGEAWPNLLAECRARGIRVSLANARLSPRSERRFRKFAAWTGPIFRLLGRVTVSEPEDVDRWERVGVERSKVAVTGSIKFDHASGGAVRVEEFRGVLGRIGFPEGGPVLLGGSTWGPEEAALGRVLLDLRRTMADLRVILVPRHVERSAEIKKELEAQGWSVVRRSQITEGGGMAADVLLVDVTGELRDWYAMATVVFVGKSLPGVAEVGGQNPAEAAALGKPVVVGPHMENFAALMDHFRAKRAVIEVADEGGLTRVVAELLADAPRSRELGARARTVLDAHIGATARTAALLAP